MKPFLRKLLLLKIENTQLHIVRGMYFAGHMFGWTCKTAMWLLNSDVVGSAQTHWQSVALMLDQLLYSFDMLM